MSVDEKIQSLLQQADDRERREESWVVIHDLLNEAEQQANDTVDMRAIGRVNAMRAKLRTRREKLIESKFDELQLYVDEEPLNVDKIRTLMRHLEELAIDSQTVITRVNRFEKDVLSPKERDIDASREYEKLKAQLNALWEQGDEAFRTDKEQNAIVKEYFEDTYKMVEAIAPEYPYYKPLQQLLEDAKQRYDNARDKALLPKTYDEINDREKELEFYIIEKQRDPYYRPLVRNKDGKEESMSLDDAIALTKQRIGEISRRRAVEGEKSYLVEARTYLNNFNPKAAEDKIQEALNLPELNDDAKAELNRFLSNDVRPALDRYKNAETDAQEAITAAKLEDALRYLRSAQDKYAHAPRVKNAESAIEQRAQKEFQDKLERIALIIRDGLLVEAQSELRRLRDEEIYWKILSDRHVQLDNQIQNAYNRIDHIQKELMDVPNVRQDVGSLVNAKNFDEANKILQAFLTEYPDADYRDKELGRLKSVIDIHLHMEKLPPTLNVVYESNDLVQIEAYVQIAQDAISSDYTVAQQNKIPALRQKLEGRMKVLQAKAMLNKTDMRSKATELFEQVSGGGADEADKKQARLLSSQMKEAVNLERQLANIEKDIELLLRDDDYVSAYGLLSPFVQDQDELPITEAWLSKRDEWWGILTSGYTLQTKNRLEDMIEDESDDLETFLNLRQRLDDLGPGLGALHNKVEERIATLEATRAEMGNDWSAAETHWERARSFNPNHVAYRQRLESARRLRVRADLNRIGADTKRLDDALNLAESYLEQRADYLEPHIWKVEILVRIANLANTPAQFDNAWSDVNRAVTSAQYITQPPHIAQLDEEKEAKRDLKKYIALDQKGNADSMSLLRFARLLVPDQNIDVLDSNVKLMTSFISENPTYVGVKSWWQSAYFPNLIATLEQRAQEQAGDYWAVFANYARLMVLDDNHPEARRLVEDMPNHLPILQTRAQNAIDNYQGSARRAEEASKAVHIQIEETEQISNHIHTVGIVTGFFSNKFKDRAVKQALEKLQELKPHLNDKLQQLRTIDNKYRSARTSALTRGILNDWTDFDNTLHEIRTDFEGQYANHTAIGNLNKLKEEIIAKRKAIQESVIELEDAFDIQNINQVKSILNQLKNLDPNDDYQLQQALQLTDNDSPTRLKGANQLELWLGEYDDEMEMLKAWLGKLVAKEDIDQLLTKEISAIRMLQTNGILSSPATKHIQQNAYFIDWERHRNDVVEPLRQKSDFAQAYAKVRDAIGDNGGQSSQRFLHESLMLITSHVPKTRDIKTAHGKFLHKLGMELTELLRRWIDEAQRYQLRLETEAAEFIQLLSQFDNLLKTANAKNKSDVDRAKAVHQKIMTLTPSYRGIYPAIDDYPQLRSQGG